MESRIRNLVFIILCCLFFFSCNKEEYNLNPDSRLEFATDTVTFDTVFTTLGTTTKWFTVKNSENQAVRISDVFLAGGNNSPFRLNINGVVANEGSDLDIQAGDSIFIFVEVTIDPTG